MRNFLLLLCLVSGLLLAGCSATGSDSPAVAPEADADAQRAIESAVKGTLAPMGVPIDTLTVTIAATEGDYVRAEVSSEDPLVPVGMTVFLKRNGEQWQVLASGSAFDGAFLDSLGIPHSLSQMPPPP